MGKIVITVDGDLVGVQKQGSDENTNILMDTIVNMLKICAVEGTEKVMYEGEANICSICGKPYTGYGNNADPVNKGRCCDTCNETVVIPERIKQWKKY